MASYSYDDFGDDEDFGLGDGVGVLLIVPCTCVSSQCSAPCHHQPASSDGRQMIGVRIRCKTTVGISLTSKQAMKSQ